MDNIARVEHIFRTYDDYEIKIKVIELVHEITQEKLQTELKLLGIKQTVVAHLSDTMSAAQLLLSRL